MYEGTYTYSYGKMIGKYKAWSWLSHKHNCADAIWERSAPVRKRLKYNSELITLNFCAFVQLLPVASASARIETTDEHTYCVAFVDDMLCSGNTDCFDVTRCKQQNWKIYIKALHYH